MCSMCLVLAVTQQGNECGSPAERHDTGYGMPAIHRSMDLGNLDCSTLSCSVCEME